MTETKFLQSVLRLFLSVDIVGSTALKQASRDGEDWQEVIAGFFSDFDRHLRTEWQSSKKNLGEDFSHLKSSEPVFWKGSGDEALYYVDIATNDEALFSVASFVKAVNSVRKILKTKDSRLDLKATGWLAGFPVNNFEIVVGGTFEPPNAENPVWDDRWVRLVAQRLAFDPKKNQNQFLDFIGPQIDLGFRLTGHATPRQMVVSVDLAWLIIEAYNKKVEKWTGRFDLTKFMYVEQRINLKGVLSGTPYPLIWIDILPNEGFHEAEFIALKKEAADPADLKKYCEKFVQTMHSKHNWMILPFIKTEGGECIGEEPEHQKGTLEQWKERWEVAQEAIEDTEPTQENDELRAEEIKKAIETFATVFKALKNI
ncbi:hypothetical protein [Terasakiella sp. SH-1]|uniref:hypothetical protein n=1 Tax=Terasakiella sp. SH-1 TaxID=2560057 RepID=UPI0010737FB5|nr:hypothetical protein [Terasakiella sp. SH-1]